MLTLVSLTSSLPSRYVSLVETASDGASIYIDLSVFPSFVVHRLGKSCRELSDSVGLSLN